MKILKVYSPFFLLSAAAYADAGPGMGASPMNTARSWWRSRALVDFRWTALVMFMFHGGQQENQDIVSAAIRSSWSMRHGIRCPRTKSSGRIIRRESATLIFIATWARKASFPAGSVLQFPPEGGFFPPESQNSPLRDEASMLQLQGFRTKVYFQEPGFKKGDTLTFKVWDKRLQDQRRSRRLLK